MAGVFVAVCMFSDASGECVPSRRLVLWNRSNGGQFQVTEAIRFAGERHGCSTVFLLLIFAVTALAVLLISGLPGQAPTQVTSALPPAIQRTPPPPADVLPSVPTRPVFK